MRAVVETCYPKKEGIYKEPTPTFAPDREWRELLSESTLALALPGSVILGQLLVLGAEIFPWPPNVSLLGLALIVLPLIAAVLMRRWHRVGLWALVLAYLASGVWVLQWSRSDAALCLLALPAGLAALAIGTGGGLAIATLGSLALFFEGGSFNLTLGSAQVASLALIWATEASLWVVTRTAGQAIQWSCTSYEEMRRSLASAQDQRVELKQMQEDLVQANLELARISDRLAAMRQVAESARRAKEEFVANVSHELRTPLNMIIGFSEMIAQSPGVYGKEIPQALLADIAVIQRNSQHLASLVNDVLDLSQVDAGRMALSREWVSLRDIIEPAVVAVSPLFESKGLALDVDISGDVPPLFCDRTRIRQVLLNLLSNAGRFTEHGGAQVRAYQEGQDLIIAVSDTGPGLPPEDQQRIFEPFEQRDGSIRRRYGGTGLGLSISKRFVELHSGKMWLESRVGEGTTFYLSLPLALQDSQSNRTTGSRWFNPYQQYQPRTRPSKAPKPKVAPRFVVVEQGTVLQHLLKRYMDGAEIVSVHDPKAAVQEVNRLPARALIINDPTLGCGGQWSSRLEDLPSGTPAISCWVPGEDQAAFEMGVRHYLVKPVGREQLLAALDDLGTDIKTVLLVDNEPEALQLFGRMLISANRGYLPLRAMNGQRALSLMREHKPDAVLLDLIMPGMDGAEVLREKNRDPGLRDIPVIAVSAQDPVKGQMESGLLTVVQSGGLSLAQLLASIRMISDLLASNEPGGQER